MMLSALILNRTRVFQTCVKWINEWSGYFSGEDNLLGWFQAIQANAQKAFPFPLFNMKLFMYIYTLWHMYSQYQWRYGSRTHQQVKVCCRCLMAVGSVASVVMVAAVVGSWWSKGTRKDTPRVCSASSGPAEDCCGAGHGWRSSSQRWAEGALSTERAEVWWSWEAIRWTLAAVSVSGAGVVPP